MINTSDFDYVRNLVQLKSAIVLESGKEALVESRLTLLARREGIESVDKLLSQLRSHNYSRLHEQVVEVMTTNETLFFRDIYPYEAMRTTVIPDLIKKRATEHRLTIWSAGCSSGQEPYSIAMLLREYFSHLNGWSIKIIASDLSKEILARAQDGRYSQFEVNRGLPAPLLVKYFHQNGVEWQIKDEIRRMVEFSDVNLADGWPLFLSVDVLFMRNVLIYFSIDTRKEILARVRKTLRPDGFLFLGAAETTLNLDDSFMRVSFDKGWCYKLNTPINT
ncbi:MAG: protein-glutamate O-methyltransferase CheR [Elusimicrobia bacterium]|nr:protein-glutamate O-methyltransferase CheR [Elusimicrobiota bacterium]